MNETKTKISRLNIPIEHDIKHRVKLEALKQNMSLQDFVALVLKKAVENKSEN